MHLLPLLAFLLLLRIKDVFVGAVDPARGYDVVLATLGVPLTLRCPYNCSTGWTRGSWHLERTGSSTCSSCFHKKEGTIQNGSLCTGLLTLQYVSVNQSSYNYTCFSVKSDDPLLSRRPERQFMVWVRAPPSAPVVTVAPPGDVWAGRPLEVTCTTQGFFPGDVTVTWSFNGSPVVGTDELTPGADADGTFYTRSTISVTPTASHHGGVAACEVHHTSLSHPLRANITLEVKYLSLHVSYKDDRESTEEVLPPPHTIRTRLGTYLKLHCLVDSNPPTTGQWVKGNVAPSRQNIGGTPATLTLGTVNVGDAGNYSCRASTGYETRELIITVEVEYPGEFSWLKVLAAVMVTVATVLTAAAVYFSLSSRRKRNARLPATTCKSGTSHDELRAENPLVTGESTLKWDQVAVTFTPADCQSDHEVPYADIMISVRGSSTPELTHIPNPVPREYRQRWKEEGGPVGLLQASRSADRLHVQQREVGRKLSTSSEYAVILYRSEPLG
ncbi:hypothetical protein AAFF_G00440090 [Aldrovandia affinis]|uniref:Ig-like domain-containing protein n=1 Tax=Aldrovandia affinis TaxID=143900 RepID=A0AAD7S743_9TELE|nr:hypothetical protein AAFF_G00440090 [Aldrovandia affinis]